ncbi:ABC transporter substrate-binding protein [Vibrio olivae]|uniref:ABC transporter substrate-binding protein n=1 Tax=Vibrio olivae TaxID=1243002 RepID=A0ABV5HHW5_9VIBR
MDRGGAMRRLFSLALLAWLPLISQANPTNFGGQYQACLSTCVTLDKPALRVVALNWSAAEMLLSLGVEPVGVTEIKGYKKWQTNHPQLNASAVEIGRRQEPNLTEIAKLKPDVIIGYDFRHQRLYSMLKRIAPTLLYQQFPRVDQPDFRYFDYAQTVFRHLALLTGKVDQGQAQLNAMHATLAQLKQQLASAGLGGKSVTYGKFIGMGYGLRIFSNPSLAGSVATALGLDYHWRNTLPGKDFVHLQLEQLPHIHDTHLLLAGNQTDSERMTTSPVWPFLPFVKTHQFSSVEPLWSFGGPASITRMAKAFTQSLLDWQEANRG